MSRLPPNIVVRAEALGDAQGIGSVHLTAFPTADEARLVDRLRADGDCEISLLAIEGTMVVGHVAFSKMQAPFRALSLGPVAVLPQLQRSGIGGALIREGLQQARDAGWQGVFVLGNPFYYERFGFSVSEAAGFSSFYAGPYFMLAPLEDIQVREGRVEYAPAFAALP